MLDSLMLLSDPVLYAIIFAAVLPFLGLFCLLKTGTYWARRHISLVDNVRQSDRKKSAVIAEDPDLVKVITHLAQIEKLSMGQQTVPSAKSKTRLMLQLRNRIKANFPEMREKEIEEFCDHLHDLAKSIAYKKIK